MVTILYSKLPKEIKPFVDCMEIIQKNGTKELSLIELNNEIERTKIAMKANEYDIEKTDTFLDYINRLKDARKSLQEFFD